MLGKLQILHPHMIAEEKPGEGYAMLRREIEREVVRRKSLASQLRTLLDSQLKVYILLSCIYMSNYIKIFNKSFNSKCSISLSKVYLDSIAQQVYTFRCKIIALARYTWSSMTGFLQVLRREQQAQWRIHSVFTSRLRECTRLLSKLYSNNQTSTELFQQM